MPNLFKIDAELSMTSLNCYCGKDNDVDAERLFHDRMTVIELAGHKLKSDITGTKASLATQQVGA